LQKSPRAGGPDPFASGGWWLAPRPPIASGGWEIRPQTLTNPPPLRSLGYAIGVWRR